MIAYATTSWFGAIPILFIWGASGPCFFIAQQHRLLNLAPEHVNVITALNSSVNYLGIACGSALGGAVLFLIPVIYLGLVGAACIVIGLILLFVSLNISKRV